MNKIALLLAVVVLAASAQALAGGRVHVRGYTRKDGTYVRPHTRSAPDGIVENNDSYRAPSTAPALPLVEPAAQPGQRVNVRGYFRSDGTYVLPHTRSWPDGIVGNNDSYRGPSGPYWSATDDGLALDVASVLSGPDVQVCTGTREEVYLCEVTRVIRHNNRVHGEDRLTFYKSCTKELDELQTIFWPDPPVIAPEAATTSAAASPLPESDPIRAPEYEHSAACSLLGGIGSVAIAAGAVFCCAMMAVPRR